METLEIKMYESAGIYYKRISNKQGDRLYIYSDRENFRPCIMQGNVYNSAGEALEKALEIMEELRVEHIFDEN